MPGGNRRTLLIGLFVLAFAFAEGTGNDWIGIALIDGYGTSAAVGTLGFAAFLAAMTAGRWFGPRSLDRYGSGDRHPGADGDLSGGCAVVCFWDLRRGRIHRRRALGVGLALGFPVGMSAGADEAAMAAPRVSVIASIGYCAFLAGPPLIGFLGDHFTVLRAVLAVAVLLAVAIMITGAVRPPVGTSASARHRPPLTASDPRLACRRGAWEIEIIRTNGRAIGVQRRPDGSIIQASSACLLAAHQAHCVSQSLSHGCSWTSTERILAVYALIGRVEIKPGHEDETLNMLRDGGVSMLRAHGGVNRRVLGSPGRSGFRTASSSTPSGSLTLRPTLEAPRRHFSRYAKCPTLPRRSSVWTCARWWARADLGQGRASKVTGGAIVRRRTPPLCPHIASMHDHPHVMHQEQRSRLAQQSHPPLATRRSEVRVPLVPLLAETVSQVRSTIGRSRLRRRPMTRHSARRTGRGRPRGRSGSARPAPGTRSSASTRANSWFSAASS